jgi:hypothetical protein
MVSIFFEVVITVNAKLQLLAFAKELVGKFAETGHGQHDYDDKSNTQYYRCSHFLS